jgi:hypothetical protein
VGNRSPGEWRRIGHWREFYSPPNVKSTWGGRTRAPHSSAPLTPLQSSRRHPAGVFDVHRALAEYPILASDKIAGTSHSQFGNRSTDAFFTKIKSTNFVKLPRLNPADSPTLPPILTLCGFVRTLRAWYNYPKIMIMLELTYKAGLQWAPVDSRGIKPTQICGVQYSIPNRFLTETPKQLEIAVTHTKQNTEVISNRDTNTTPSNAIRPLIVGLADAPSASRSGRNRRAGLSHHHLSRTALMPNQQTPSLSSPYRARRTPFLIVSPKRLKIAVSQRKQNTEVISNRIKIGHSRNAVVDRARVEGRRKDSSLHGNDGHRPHVSARRCRAGDMNYTRRGEVSRRAVLLDFIGWVDYAARTLGDREGFRISAPSLVQSIGWSNQERSLGGRIQ